MIHLYKILHENVLSSIIHNNHTVSTTQMPTHGEYLQSVVPHRTAQHSSLEGRSADTRHGSETLEDTTLSESSQAQRTTCCGAPFMRNAQNKQTQTESTSAGPGAEPGAGPWGWGRGRGVPAHGDEVGQQSVAMAVTL